MATTVNLGIRHCVLDRDRVPVVKGDGQALEQESRLLSLLDDVSIALARQP